MIYQLQNGNGIEQINTDLLINKVSAEDFKEVVNAIQTEQPLTEAQHAMLIEANVLTPVREIDLSLPDINLPGKAEVQAENVPDPTILAPLVVDAEVATPVVKKKKPLKWLDQITNSIYKIIFKK